MIWLIGVIILAALGIAWVSLLVFYWVMRILLAIICILIGIFTVTSRRLVSNVRS